MERFFGDKNFKEVAHIVAMSQNSVIGDSGILPWTIPEDLLRFKSLTVGKTVLMGRKTYRGLPKKLLNRRIVVVSSKGSAGEFPEVYHSIDGAFESISDDKYVMIAGGESIYRQTIDRVSSIYLTLVHTKIEGDARYFELEELLKDFKVDYERRFESEPSYSFMRLERIT